MLESPRLATLDKVSGFTAGSALDPLKGAQGGGEEGELQFIMGS